MEELESLVALAQAPDISLVQRHAAFTSLVVRFQDMAYGYAYALLGDSHLAQDATQEAFLTAYQIVHQLREPRAFPGWLRRIILTKCQRLRRAEHTLIHSIGTLPERSSDQPDPSTTVEYQELQAQVQAAIQALPEPLRMATVLYYINGYSQSEVAAFLDVSVDAIKKRLQRARNQLQERMLAMARDNLRKQRPSQDDQFVQAVQLFMSLHAAAEQSQLTTIELMLVDGVDVGTINEDGQTLLHWAVQQGHREAVELLVTHGAPLNIRDRFGKTPLGEAMERGYEELAEVLRQHGGKA